MKCPDCGGPSDVEILDGQVLMRTIWGARCQDCGRVYGQKVEVDNHEVRVSYEWQDTAATALRRICGRTREVR